MTKEQIEKEIGEFERSHKGIEITYTYDDDEDIDAYWFKMTKDDYYCIEREVSGRYLCLLIFGNPLPDIFFKMFYELEKYCENKNKI